MFSKKNVSARFLFRCVCHQVRDVIYCLEAAKFLLLNDRRDLQCHLLGFGMIYCLV